MGKRNKKEKGLITAFPEWEDRLVYSTDPVMESGSEQIFTNKPFQKLDAKKFPSERICKGKISSKAPETDSDREMFLDALSRPETGRKGPSHSGFKLSEQCPALAFAPAKKKAKAHMPAIPSAPISKEPEEDENAAFLQAMRKTMPLSGKGRKIPKKPVLAENPIREQGFMELLDKQLEFTLLFSDEYLEGKVAGLDEMIMNRLREGQMSPEAHLDLHGLNAEQAFEAMRVFIRDAWFKSLRVVLLVPGRGRNSPAGYGILRRKVQEWLTHEPFKRVVLAFCTARPHDGGPGSIYVLLRRFRKKGHISWDKLSADPDLFNF